MPEDKAVEDFENEGGRPVDDAPGVDDDLTPEEAAAELERITQEFEARRDAEEPQRVEDGVTVPFRVEAPAEGTPMMPPEIYSGQVGDWLDKLRELLKAKGHQVAEEGPLVEADAEAIEAQLAQAGRDVQSAFHLGVEDWKALWRSVL